MLLGIALDGADSPRGGCTTHLAALLARSLCSEGYTLFDYPWLVRLDPAVPMKTRGNGAVALWLLVDTRSEAERVWRRVLGELRAYSSATGSAGKAAAAALLLEEEHLRARPPALRLIYYRAVSDYVPRSVALRAARLAGVAWLAGGGVTGPLAALGADLAYDHTFELLLYMPPRLWGRRPRLPDDLVLELRYRLGPYDIASYDPRRSKPLIQPHGPDPVLAGIRSEEPGILRETAALIPRDYFDAAILYRTNQHTDAHLQPLTVSEIRPYKCGTVEATVEDATMLPGGHALLKICDETGCTYAAVYRETGLARYCTRLLGRRARIAGCAKPHRGLTTLNVEKMHVGGALLEPPPSAWHHLYMPGYRYERVQRPRGLRPPGDACRDSLALF